MEQNKKKCCEQKNSPDPVTSVSSKSESEASIPVQSNTVREPLEKPVLSFQHVSKSFGSKTILEDISFSVPAKSRLVLYGPSGSGKSTILRLIAGLIQPDCGDLWIDPDLKVSLVFQEDRLFGSIKTIDNILYGLYAGSLPKVQMIEKAKYWAKVFSCSDYLNQKTKTLSGGQRQRAALARAFMKDPDLVLLDESFSSMDAALKDDLMHKLLELQKDRGFTIVFVTHNYDEARIMGEQMLVLKNGQMVQYGSVWDAVLRPADLFEAKAFGGYTWNLIPEAAIKPWIEDFFARFPKISCEKTLIIQEDASKKENTSSADGGLSDRARSESLLHDLSQTGLPARFGWAGISAYNCSTVFHADWVSIPARSIEVRNLGYCWLHLLEIGESKVYAASQENEYDGLFWMNPKQLLYFDEDGLLIDDEDH